ncbi:MAG: hypothetical protein Q9175_005007 [Cornicularia normoerica]
MRDKRTLPSREPDRRGPSAVHDYDERTSRRKAKVADPQDDRDRDGLLPNHRSMAIRPDERDRDRDSISYYQGRSRHASKLMSSEEAQKAIGTLLMQVKETMSFFASFKQEYQREVCGIEAYAGQTMLEKLWERKIKKFDSKRRPSKNRPKDDGAGLRSEFDGVSNRLWNSLNDAYEGAISHPSGQNDSMARKLDSAMTDVGKLLTSVRQKSQETDSLINELKVLRVVLELGGAGTASHDDRASPRPRAHADGHGGERDSTREREDVRYGGTREDSGSEDIGQHDEQRSEHSERWGGREERELGGNEEGQGVGGGDSWGAGE